MDYHKILGTKPGDNLDKLKAAYRKQAAKLHPDKGGSAEEFAKLHEAYEQLKIRASHRVDIPIQGNLDTIRVMIPLDSLSRASRYQFTFKDKLVEVDLPDWRAEWHHEHTFTLKDHSIKLVVVADHSRFWIQDKELTTRIDITSIDSLLGTQVTVLGKSLVVPAGTVTGDHISLPGLGLFDGYSYADLSCIFNIVTVQLTESDVDLTLRELQQKYRK